MPGLQWLLIRYKLIASPKQKTKKSLEELLSYQWALEIHRHKLVATPPNHRVLTVCRINIGQGGCRESFSCKTWYSKRTRRLQRKCSVQPLYCWWLCLPCPRMASKIARPNWSSRQPGSNAWTDTQVITNGLDKNGQFFFRESHEWACFFDI